MISFESVTKRYPDGTVAVDSLDLALPEGQITVFVGPSGCGKTTSLRMINRMVEPTSGRVLVGGRDVMAHDPAELRLEIGYVIQQVGLFPHRTVLDNIATVPLLLGWSKKKARARAAELLPRVGLPESYASRFPIQLSGGQQQRVGAARALDVSEIETQQVDVLAPCALGGTLTGELVPRLRARVIAGVANNQLAEPEVGRLLAADGVLYAPDYVINAGGVINNAMQLEDYDRSRVMAKSAGIYDTLLETFAHADQHSMATSDAADALALARPISNAERSNTAAALS